MSEEQRSAVPQQEGGREGGYVKKTLNRAPKKRICPFCLEKDADKKTLYIDYKDGRLKKYLAENGKIFPHRQTGVCATHQRELAKAIKTAKKMGLL